VRRRDYRIVAGAGDGPRSEYPVKAAELPESLPVQSATQVTRFLRRCRIAIAFDRFADRNAGLEAGARPASNGPLREQLASYETRCGGTCWVVSAIFSASRVWAAGSWGGAPSRYLTRLDENASHLQSGLQTTRNEITVWWSDFWASWAVSLPPSPTHL
jgi:hypothetical protein